MKFFIVSILLVLTAHITTLHAKDCSDYEAAFDIAQYTMQEQGKISYRKSYDLINTVIDTATEYLAYCKKEITLADQYQIQRVIKKADKKRGDYFKGAVREYHSIYGIRPNVKEIFQDGGYYYDGVSGTSGYSSPPRFPTIVQPQMPSIQR